MDDRIGKDQDGGPRVRLADVARETGVSVATVSRCLNTPAQVNAKTRSRVLEVVKRLGYLPDRSAQALKTGRSSITGAVVPTLENSIFARGLQSFQDELSAGGATLLLACSNYDPDAEFEQIRTLVSQGVGGLMLIGASREPAVYAFLQRHGVDYVLGWTVSEPHSYVGFDNAAAARDMARAMIDAGHRRIAMVAGRARDNDRAAERIAGVRTALSHAELPAPHVVECDYSFEAAAEALEAIVAAQDRPTAIVCGNDVQGVGVLMRAEALGIRVPDDMVVAGFDDIDLARVVRPGLATVHVPHYRMGRLAARALLEGRPVRTELETRIVHRGSFPGSRDP